MSDHLSQDQFETCVLGQAGPAELEHISECPECRAEFEHFGRTLSLFRSAVWDRVDDRIGLQAAEVTTLTPAAAGIPRWRLALVAAGFVVVVVIPFFITEIQPRERTDPGSAESPEAVMERLNRHLLRTMPEPMEPVMSLIPSQQFASKPGRVQ